MSASKTKRTKPQTESVYNLKKLGIYARTNRTKDIE